MTDEQATADGLRRFFRRAGEIAAQQVYTVFWSHPVHGDGEFELERDSAKIAGDEALNTLGEDLADNELDDLEIATIRDDLEIVVYAGSHRKRPDREPDYRVE